MALEITDQNIGEVLTSEKLVVMDFWAAWCGPCRMIGPIINELANDNTDVIIGKVDVTSNPESSAKYGVTSIPTIIFLKDGAEVYRQKGAVPKSALQSVIDEFKN
jgi:thioredoxin 1